MITLPGLRRVRERALLTQEELAQKAGITRAALSRIETGQASARISSVRKLAQALDVDAALLMDAEPNAGRRR